GRYEVSVSAPGFGRGKAAAVLTAGEASLHFELAPATLAQEIQVTASQVLARPEDLSQFPGSAAVLSAATLAQSRVFTTEEALRKVSGVHARSEDGFGLRPNVGIRGLNPTRSTRVLLLEDGIPLSYAPYGDNASYYHPPVDRFEGVEVVKGASQILYGPMTVGGVINYLTPPPPEQTLGSLTLLGGNRNYGNASASLGTRWGTTSALVSIMRKQGEGSRENTRHGLVDFNSKVATAVSSRQSLTFRFNYYREDSNITYSGLRQSEWDANPRANPFRNDFFYIHRYGGSVTHSWAVQENLVLTTNAYATSFSRDWWRQSSNSGQRPNDSADPACGGMANLNTTCGNEGRLRLYHTWGLDPKFKWNYPLAGARSETAFGFRYHGEIQNRRQKNGPLPHSRDGVIVEDNDRLATAFSGFLQNQFLVGRWSLTPGLRLEGVRYERTNFLANAGQGVTGETSFTTWIPGLGAAYRVAGDVTLFAGIHRGFAPPRVEDAIDNNTGASVDLDAELSWNTEAGIRASLHENFRIEATFFRMDFENQIVPSSIAGGAGATLTNAGETLHQGVELAGKVRIPRILPPGHSLTLRSSYTALPVAKYVGTRFSSISGFTNVSVTGNRLPYAPRHLLTADATYIHSTGLQVFLEAVYTGSQFADDLNTIAGTPDGQRGLIPGNALWNVALNYPLSAWNATLFLTVKNLGDRLVIADRTRGLLPGIPRLVQAGMHIAF
ncbi:MAG TPA: TonB-dependent receptor, partial [Terriglobia bacterium]|nr:TonB-dependent receptor [Terriglobia bacterium]